MQALVHMGQPNLTGRGPDGVAVDGMDRPNSAHLSGIPQMPMLIIPAASAAEIMQQLRGSAVALIPTSGQHGGVPLPIQPSQTGLLQLTSSLLVAVSGPQLITNEPAIISS